MGKEFFAGYAKVVGALQTVRPTLHLVNKNVPACDTHIKNILTDYDRENAIKRRAVHKDCETNTPNNGYTPGTNGNFVRCVFLNCCKIKRMMQL